MNEREEKSLLVQVNPRLVGRKLWVPKNCPFSLLTAGRPEGSGDAGRVAGLQESGTTWLWNINTFHGPLETTALLWTRRTDVKGHCTARPPPEKAWGASSITRSTPGLSMGKLGPGRAGTCPRPLSSQEQKPSPRYFAGCSLYLTSGLVRAGSIELR